MPCSRTCTQGRVNSAATIRVKAFVNSLQQNKSLTTPGKFYGVLAEENYLQKLNRKEFIHRLAYYYDMTNRLHPFPEGNGRTQRLFIEHLATLSGHSINWALVHQWEIGATAERSFQGDKEPLFRMFERIVCVTHQETGSSN